MQEREGFQQSLLCSRMLRESLKCLYTLMIGNVVENMKWGRVRLVHGERRLCHQNMKLITKAR